MQLRRYNERAGVAVVTDTGIRNEAVMGSYVQQEQFPYDDNILKNFKGDPFQTEILEYGCGPARNLRRMSPLFGKVCGVDISPLNIKNATKVMELAKYSNFELKANGGQDIPFEDNRFGIVFEVICLQHICSYSIRKSILREMARVCKEGGIVVCQFGFNKEISPNSHYVGYHAEQLVGVQDTNGASDCCVLDEKELVDDFKDVGLSIVEIWHTGTVMDQNHHDWIWICGKKYTNTDS